MYFTQPSKSQQAVTYSGTHRKLCSNQKSPSWQLGSEGRFLFSSHDTWRRPCLSASLGILVLRTQWPALVLTPACRLPPAVCTGKLTLEEQGPHCTFPHRPPCYCSSSSSLPLTFPAICSLVSPQSFSLQPIFLLFPILIFDPAVASRRKLLHPTLSPERDLVPWITSSCWCFLHISEECSPKGSCWASLGLLYPQVHFWYTS